MASSVGAEGAEAGLAGESRRCVRMDDLRCITFFFASQSSLEGGDRLCDLNMLRGHGGRRGWSRDGFAGQDQCTGRMRCHPEGKVGGENRLEEREADLHPRYPHRSEWIIMHCSWENESSRGESRSVAFTSLSLLIRWHTHRKWPITTCAPVQVSAYLLYKVTTEP
jgi:hypothetical protein